MRKLPLLAVSVALVAGACNDAAEPTTTIAETTTTTTTEPPSTTATTTTTTAPPRVIAVRASGGVPPALAEQAATLFSALADERNPVAEVPAGLVARLAAVQIPDAVRITSMSTATLPDGESVGVARTDAGDVVLAIDDGTGWRIVGADMDSLGVEPWYGESPHMVLIIGTDARQWISEPLGYHADSIHVVTAIPEQGTGAILGWPRDSLVETPYGKMKLTALNVNRGPEVMEEFFHDEWELPVAGYIATGFAGFEDLIGILGRLDIDIPRGLPTQEWFAGFRAGEQSLTPVRALDYSRTRKGVPGGDLTRSYNQGLVMLAAMVMLQLEGIDALPGYVAALAQFTHTNLSAEQLLLLGAAAMALDPTTIENQVLPGKVGRAVGASVVFLDPEADVMIADLRDDGLLESRDS